MKALDGIRILDLTQFLAGPHAGMMLADFGAETIMVEPPGTGVATRAVYEKDPEASIDGVGANVLTQCRGKKSITLDLKQSEGRQLFYELVKRSDVVLSNFRPGVLERLKITYEDLRPLNPRIITCSVTGFGRTGPGKDRAAYDMVAQCYSGGMSITGEPGRMPIRAGLPFGDMVGGLLGTIGVLTALQARERTGEGQDVDISMLDGQISMWNHIGTYFLMTGKEQPHLGNEHFLHMPYGAYPTKDLYLVVACVSDKMYRDFAAVLGNPVLLEEQRMDRYWRLEHRAEMNQLIEAETQKWTCDELLEKLQARGVPCGPVNDMERAFADPQVLARNMVVEGEFHGRKYRMPGNPVKMSGTPSETFGPAPALGEHNGEVYQGLLNMSAAELEGLRGKGLV